MADPKKISGPSDARPALDDSLSAADFRDFYWMKAELQSFCRRKGIVASGGKLEIADRIAGYLETGHVAVRSVTRQRKSDTRFDWANGTLTPQTAITADYRNTRRVREFFTERIGLHFRITVPFMAWMRENEGKTLGDAVVEWGRQHLAAREVAPGREISPQFEYNRYVRAFMADNPGRPRKDAVACWMVRKTQRGSRTYQREDLRFLNAAG